MVTVPASLVIQGQDEQIVLFEVFEAGLPPWQRILGRDRPRFVLRPPSFVRQYRVAQRPAQALQNGGPA